MSGNEDLDIIDLEFPHYREIFEFLKSELQLPLSTNKQKYALANAIKEACTDYQKTEITDYQRGVLIKTAIESAAQFKNNIDAILADSPLCHFSFSPTAGSNFDINRMMQLQGEVSKLEAWLITAQSHDFVRLKKLMGIYGSSNMFFVKQILGNAVPC